MITRSMTLRSLGKGEVECSIHSGSTINQRLLSAALGTSRQNAARTCTSHIEISLNFVRGMFAARGTMSAPHRSN